MAGPGGAVCRDGGSGLDAVVLAGGRASRAGGIDKPGLLVGGRTLLAAVVAAAVEAGADRVIVAGPRRAGLAAPGTRPPHGLVFVQEDPPGSGPVAALRAALPGVSAPVVLLLAADLPFLAASALAPLAAAVGRGEVGAMLLDDRGRPQWLAGCWRTRVLRAALDGYAGRSLHGLLAPLRPAMLSCPPEPGRPPPWLDCDTAEDLARARRLARDLPRPAPDPAGGGLTRVPGAASSSASPTTAGPTRPGTAAKGKWGT